MPIDFGLLSKAALSGLNETEQNDLQRQATTQFLLGSLLSGDASMGYKAAQGIPDQYLSSQKNMMDLAEKKRQREEVTNFLSEFAPTPMQAGQRALGAEGRGPTNTAAQNQQAILNAPIDFNRAFASSLRLAGNPAQAQIQNTLGAMQPKLQPDGIITDPNLKATRSLPTQKDLVQNQFNIQTGRFEAQPVVGALGAKIGTTLPEVPVGAQLKMDDAGLITTNLIPGISQVNQQQAFDKQFGQGQANLRTTTTPVMNIATGRPELTTQAQAIGMPTALSPAEDLGFKGYGPIREDAFKKSQAASASDTSLQNMQNILNRGAFKPGKFAEFKAEAAAIATGLGIGGDAAKNIATDAPLLLQTFADTVSTNIQDMSGAISNADVIFQKQRGPQIKDPEQAVQYYIDLKQSLNKRSKDYFNYVAKNPVPDVVEKWSQTPQGSASIFEDPKLRKYLPQFTVNAGPDKGKKAYQLPTGVFRVYD
jgi:hypothetical protein